MDVPFPNIISRPMVSCVGVFSKEGIVIGPDGKPLDRPAILAAVGVYNTESRGSPAFAALPRALVTILDGLQIGKTTYVKGKDGQIQLTRGKDRKVAAK
jgi:hypothetical protein